MSFLFAQFFLHRIYVKFRIPPLLLGCMKMILENKPPVLQNYNGSQKLSQIGNFRL
ncbi:hypothetical protein LEP1GSC036_0088 [Leptospira weilii str. 2006001853]|uniref:Uncharacterized protein n=1 Tax=Leptospira weilii str. 2006001853 TaxID=1001589 RepID=A0A828YXZ0_9LEPT|nr:hypothetical protein LEP1GSC036_0088 [Leptospira weilii str. 2006001853]EMN45967.1 hypothetical protein LEP1GSC086_2313 [Leptospira weilii str. LNT 1234]